MVEADFVDSILHLRTPFVHQYSLLLQLSFHCTVPLYNTKCKWFHLKANEMRRNKNDMKFSVSMQWQNNVLDGCEIDANGIVTLCKFKFCLPCEWFVYMREKCNLISDTTTNNIANEITDDLYKQYIWVISSDICLYVVFSVMHR